ncbi:MAG: hypothetical protein GQ527_12975, partial [Bacteroidales bacterium]|nr:hypothetical protein [Bacteroidales bacterium]
MLRKSMIFLFFYLGISWASFAQEPGDLEASLVVVENIELIGNKVTVDKILYREITIRPGDTLTKADFLQGLKESQENLMNTSLFNFVTIHEEITNNGALIHYAVKIEVIERWYIWPLPIFELAERNFNAWWETKDLEKINYGLFLNWENFRGRKEHLKLLLQFGYDEKLGVSYSIPYIDKRQTIGVMFGFNQTKNHEVSYITTDNQVQRVRLDDYALIDYHGFLAFSHRANIYQTHHIETSYNDKNFADTVFQLNPVFYQGESNRAQFI